jgi:hypothetical protein
VPGGELKEGLEAGGEEGDDFGALLVTGEGDGEPFAGSVPLQ